MSKLAKRMILKVLDHKVSSLIYHPCRNKVYSVLINSNSHYKSKFNDYRLKPQQQLITIKEVLRLHSHLAISITLKFDTSTVFYAKQWHTYMTVL